MTLKSSGKSFAARIIDFDDDFIEVIVRIKDDGEYSKDRNGFANGNHTTQDRILVAIDDISTIA